MKVLFDITHPAHVHLFRHAIGELIEQGHEVLVTSREKDLTIDLLDSYEMDHVNLSKKRNGEFGTVIEWTKREIKLLLVARSFDPDVMVSRFNPAMGHVSTLLGCPCLFFDDTENKPFLLRKCGYPFADRIYTPDSFKISTGANQVSYPSYHELAYLHPNRFTPDPSIKEDAGLDEDERFVILRLVSWDAAHDVNDSGFKDAVDVVSELESTGVTVLITSEDDLPQEIEHCQISVGPHRTHHLMYYADLFIGESATMASESAVLGTPAVFVSSSRRGYTDELEKKYGLVFNYSEDNRHQHGIDKAIDILTMNSDSEWETRRRHLLEDKIDATEYILNKIKEKAM